MKFATLIALVGLSNTQWFYWFPEDEEELDHVCKTDEDCQKPLIDTLTIGKDVEVEACCSVWTYTGPDRDPKLQILRVYMKDFGWIKDKTTGIPEKVKRSGSNLDIGAYISRCAPKSYVDAHQKLMKE